MILYLLHFAESDAVCESDFISVEGLHKLLGRDSRVKNEEVANIPANVFSFIFPSIEFTDIGYVEKWIFAATALSAPSIAFQIWRRSVGQTILQHTTTLSNVTVWFC